MRIRRKLLLGAALLFGALAFNGPPTLAVDGSDVLDDLFEIGVNEDTLSDVDGTIKQGKNTFLDPRANIIGCLDADLFSPVDPTGFGPCDGTSDDTITIDSTEITNEVTPGGGPDWGDLFEGELNTDFDPDDTDRAFVLPSFKDEVKPDAAHPGFLVSGSNGVDDFVDYGGIVASFVGDEISAASLTDETTTVSVGSDKNEDLPNTYQWNSDSVPAKDDITNLYCYAATGSDLIIYCGLERLSNDGASHIDIEINQDEIALDEDAPCEDLVDDPSDDFKADPDTCFLTGDRTAGDLLVTLDFEAGGDFGAAEIRIWDGTTWGDPVVELDGEGCNEDIDLDGDTVTDILKDSVCAFANNGNINGGDWPNFLGSATPLDSNSDSPPYSTGELPRNAFSEFGLNVTEILDQTACFSTLLIKTRSSPSFDAELKDFAVAEFQVCGIQVSKTCEDTDVVLNDAGDTVNISYSGTVRNTGALPLYIELTESNDSGAASVFDAVCIDDNGTPGECDGGDASPAGLSGVGSDTVTFQIAAGEIVRYEGSYEVTGQLEDLTFEDSVTATAFEDAAKTIQFGDPETATDDCSTTGNPAILVTKDCDGFFDDHDTFRAEITGKIKNTGNVKLVEIEIADTDVVDSQITINGGTVNDGTFDIAELAPNQEVNFSYSITYDDTTTTHSDTLTATGTNFFDAQDTVTDDDVASCGITVTQDLEIVKVCDPAFGSVTNDPETGDKSGVILVANGGVKVEVHTIVTVTNPDDVATNEDLTSVVVTDPEGGLAYFTGPAFVCNGAGTECTGDLGFDEEVVFKQSYQPDATSTILGALTNPGGVKFENVATAEGQGVLTGIGVGPFNDDAECPLCP